MEQAGRAIEPQLQACCDSRSGTHGSGPYRGLGSNRLRICVVLLPIEPYSPSGGAIATVAHNVARSWERSGHSVTVLAPRGEAPPYPAGTSIALDIPRKPRLPGRVASRIGHSASWDWPGYRSYLKAVSAAVQTLEPAPNVLVAHNDLQLLPELSPLIPSAETVLWLHNTIQTARPEPRSALGGVDRIIAVSNYVARWTEQRYGLSAGTVRTAYNGVDTERFHPGERSRQAGSALHIVCHGRIDPGKGFHLVAESVGRLRARGVAVQLTVAGGLQAFGIASAVAVAYRNDLLESLSDVGGTYRGRLDPGEVPDLLRGADVACAPSVHPDPFPLSALEAMASGCALVASDRGGLPEVVGHAGLLIDPDDPGTLDTALTALATDPVLLATRQRAARARAEQLSWSTPAAIALGEDPGPPPP